MPALGQRPKSKEIGTRRRILDHARQAFNERGVDAVGVRDLARELGLSPGNLSYHFPTKEALVAELVEEVHATNNAVATPASQSDGPLDFIQLDRIIRNVMQRDLDHRWFMRDAATLTLSLPALREQHERRQRAREERVDALVARLVEGRMLDGERLDRPLLRVQVLTQIFFWLPSALLAQPDRDPAKRLDLHARAALGLFEVHATSAGRRQIRALVAPGRK